MGSGITLFRQAWYNCSNECASRLWWPKVYPSSIRKIKIIKKKIDASHPHIELEIDGGVNFENIESILEAGADVIVAGTTTFTGGEKEYANNIAKLRG